MKYRLSNIKELIKLIYEVSPGYFIVLLLNTIVGSVGTYINLWVAKIVIDQLANTHNISICFKLIILMVISAAILLLIDNLMKYIVNIKTPLVREKMKKLMTEKIMELPYYKLEDSSFLDLKERAMFAINEQGAIFNIIYNFAEICKNIAIVISIVGVFLSCSKVFVVFLLFIILCMFFLYIKYITYQKEFYDKLLLLNRREALYRDIVYDKKYSIDFRLYETKKLLSNRYSSFLDKSCKLIYKFNLNKGNYLAFFNIMDNIIKIGVYGYIGMRRFSNLFDDTISIGSCIMYINAVSNFSSKISKISENIVQIKQMLKYLEPYLEFMEFNDTNYEGDERLEEPIKEIRFEKVYFKYPGAVDYALKDVSFVIKQGDRIAIAGPNGSGKTTIIKLICKLYSPTSGEIYVNGKNILCYDTECYLDAISAIFQDFKIFNYSLAKNITLEDKFDKRAEEIAEKVGLNKLIEKLPNGIDSIIGKDYDKDGNELSGGEYQKIAIARAAYKVASLYIMDEPTSALDPITELEVFEDIQNIIERKTAIFVSHRMSSCKLCDKILVLDNGKIVESGTHDELIRKSGIYCKLYLAQAQVFNNKKGESKNAK